MKKLMLLAIIFTSTGLFAQNASFGIKGGLNYGATGEYESFTALSGDFVSSFEDGEDKTGFHAGIFAQFEIWNDAAIKDCTLWNFKEFRK